MTTRPEGVGAWWSGTKPAGVYYSGVLATFTVFNTSPYETREFSIGPGLLVEGDRVFFDVTVVPVPEPASFAALGIGALALARRCRLKSASR
jgi:hypothetical protein